MPAGVVLLGQVAAHLPVLDVSCNRCPRSKLDSEKLLALTERVIAAAAQLAAAKDVPPDLREQAEAALRKSLPTVKKPKSALAAPANSSPDEISQQPVTA
jgi:hypothetical protein